MESNHIFNAKNESNLVGLTRIQAIADAELQVFITVAEADWKLLLNPSIDPQLKMNAAINLLLVLGKIQAYCKQQAINIDLDVMHELQKYYDHVIRNASHNEIRSLKALVEKTPFEISKKSTKLSQNHKQAKLAKYLLKAIEHGFTPPMLLNLTYVFTTIDDTEKLKHSDHFSLSKKIAKQDRLAKQFNEIYELIKLTNEDNHQIHYKRKVVMPSDIEKKASLKNYSFFALNSIGVLTDQKVDAVRGERYHHAEKILARAFALLHDKEFVARKNSTAKKWLQNLIREQLDVMLDDVAESQFLKQKLQADQACYALANDIIQLIDFATLSKNYLANPSPNDEESFIRTALQNKNYQIQAMGNGNNRVYLITDSNNVAVILRGRDGFSVEFNAGRSPDQLRYRISHSLSLGGYATQQYRFIPGVKGNFVSDENGLQYRNYEISEAMCFGDIKAKLANLIQDFSAGNITLYQLQLNVIDLTIKLVDLVLELRDRSLCYPDLKPGNLLLDRDDEIILSDLKTILDIAKLDPQTLIHEAPEPLQLTPGYTSPRATEKGKYAQAYYLHVVMAETLAFTIYQLLTGHFSLETQFDYDLQLKQLTDLLTPDMQNNIATHFGNIIQNPLGDKINEIAIWLGKLVKGNAKIEDILSTIDTPDMRDKISKLREATSAVNPVMSTSAVNPAMPTNMGKSFTST